MPLVDPPQPVTAVGASGIPTGNGSSLTGNHVFGGNGVPPASLGVNGDFYYRHDTPGTANQRQYIKSGGSWTALTV